jgi:hypothetical protein
MDTKICSKCGIEKELSYFNKEKTCEKGVRPECRSCSTLYALNNYRRNKEKIKKNVNLYQRKYPWKRTFAYITQRCNNPKASCYSYYGGKGVLCLITEEEIKFLWFRDRAYEMKRPSIHRINNKSNYCLYNCQFLEWEEHVKIR